MCTCKTFVNLEYWSMLSLRFCTSLGLMAVRNSLWSFFTLDATFTSQRLQSLLVLLFNVVVWFQVFLHLIVMLVQWTSAMHWPYLHFKAMLWSLCGVWGYLFGWRIAGQMDMMTWKLFALSATTTTMKYLCWQQRKRQCLVHLSYRETGTEVRRPLM